MRKEPFTVGNFVHIYNRGNRKLSIVRDESDKCYFIHALYYSKTVLRERGWAALAMNNRTATGAAFLQVVPRRARDVFGSSIL